ncbi:H-type small acid-soluble spore protein [Bacillus horti]|uniref:Small, acid-soluble spore protein H n=1 Tax=Caldalkalibacillus horti TaxID=77523 RepID=A0ABT9VZW2_9BACI|nr:H-type small acid-soluble spore protein [Bacillus horti]MDQ0166536.1 small acid-soluble spore protein H (minor) [Bacillus horti]
MDIGRAKQIVDSTHEIVVHHQGVPVWIQHINDGDATARVYTRENPDNEMVVSVSELVEEK